MDSNVWVESVSTALATLENALLGENAELPSSRVNSTVRSTLDSRKHTRRTPSDTVSDIESHGDAPVKRRRESINSGNGGVYAVANSGITKQSAKCRKITSALSSQFARSLSMSSTNRAMKDSMDTKVSTLGENGYADAIGSADTRASTLHVPSCFMPSSSSSGSSSASPLPGSPISQAIGFPPESDEKHGRELHYFMAGRSLKAREKTRAGLKNLSPNDRTLHGHDSMHSAMDLDPGDSSTPLSPAFSSSHLADPDEDFKSSCAFASLLQPHHPQGLHIGSEEMLHSAVQQWARGQAYNEQASDMLMDETNQRIVRLKHIIPPLLAHSRGTVQVSELQGDQLQEFYKAGCELASIGEWLYQRQFPFLPTIFPDLQHELPLIQGIVQMSRVAEDMYRLLQSAPELSTSLGEMTTQYEDIVRTKRLMYREILAQDGLACKTIGLPVDTLLLLRVRQWFALVTEQCMVRIARVCECRANSASAYNKEDISADALNQCSHRVLHAASQCANLCGSCFPVLAPQVLFIVSECVVWTNNKFRSAAHTQHKTNQPFVLTNTSLNPGKQAQRDQTNTTIYRGKQLESRALRLAQACEGILKLLSFTKTIITIDSTLFDAQNLRNDLCTQPVFIALQALAASLVEMSWTLAEFLAAFRLDGRFLTPSGSTVLFVYVVVKFAKKVVHFGGSKVVSRPDIQRSMRQLQCFLGSLDGSRTSGTVSVY